VDEEEVEEEESAEAGLGGGLLESGR